MGLFDYKIHFHRIKIDSFELLRFIKANSTNHKIQQDRDKRKIKISKASAWLLNLANSLVSMAAFQVLTHRNVNKLIYGCCKWNKLGRILWACTRFVCTKVDILHAHGTCNNELTRCPEDYLPFYLWWKRKPILFQFIAQSVFCYLHLSMVNEDNNCHFFF